MMWDHILHCIADFLTTPWKAGVSLVSLAAGTGIMLRINTRGFSLPQKISLAYAQIAAFAFPLVLFVFTMACQSFGMHCNTSLARKIIYAVPATFTLSLLAGFVLIPSLYRLSERTIEITGGQILKKTSHYAKRMGIRTPKVFNIDTQAPAAFSFSSLRPSIFLSIGLQDILSRKETEAVIIHELAHIKSNSSSLKASSLFLRMLPFSILRSFGADMNLEERRADRAVIRMQKTGKHLNSAKRKFESYERNIKSC